MKIIIFGLGSIGRRHAQILLNNFNNYQLFAFRSNSRAEKNNLGIKEVNSWPQVEKLNAQAAFITNPTALHIRTALRCARSGMHIFMEKPLSHSLKNINELERICGKKGLSCYVAYCLRFHPLIIKIRNLLKGKKIYHARISCSSYLPDWRKKSNYRKSYSSLAALGGGVLLDLSHEFDYIEYLFGRIVDTRGAYGRLSDLTVDSEDYADVLLKTDRLIHINLHLNFLSRMSERSIKVDFKDGYISGDLLNSRLDYFYRGSSKTYAFNVKREDFFTAQTRYFFDNLGNPAIMNGISQARQLLNNILEFKRKNRHTL